MKEKLFKNFCFVCQEKTNEEFEHVPLCNNCKEGLKSGKICHYCHKKEAKPLKNFICGNCSIHIEIDKNEDINIAKEELKTIATNTQKAFEELERCCQVLNHENFNPAYTKVNSEWVLGTNILNILLPILKIGIDLSVKNNNPTQQEIIYRGQVAFKEFVNKHL